MIKIIGNLEYIQDVVNKSVEAGNRDWEMFQTRERYIVYELDLVQPRAGTQKRTLRNLGEAAEKYMREESRLMNRDRYPSEGRKNHGK